MALLRNLWIIVTTSLVAGADTDASFTLELRHAVPNPNFVVRLPFPNLPSPDERERGATDQYKFASLEEHLINMALLTPEKIFVEIDDDDAWLPSSIWAIGEDVSGRFALLASVPNWPTSVARGWFSSDADEGQQVRSLRP